MSVMNRKMFNRGARKELRKKGGIEDVQYFQTAGQVKAPSGKLSLNLSGGPFASSSPIFGSGKYNLGQIYSKNNPYPSTLSGKMFGSGKRFFAPAKSSSPSQMGLINIAKKAAEGGMGALEPTELMILQQYLSGQGLQNLVEDTGLTTKLGSVGDAAGGIANVLGQVAGIPVGLIRSAFTEEGGPASKEYDKNLGTFTPDERLLKQLGFVFEEDLYGGQKGKIDKGLDPKASAELAAELAKPAVAPPSKINPGELEKMLQSSGKEIEKLLSAQKDKGMTVFAEEDEFDKDAKPAVITSFDKTGKEIVPQPFGKPTQTDEEIASQGLTLDKMIGSEVEEKGLKMTDDETFDLPGTDQVVEEKDEKLTEENSVTITNNETNQQEKVPDLQKGFEEFSQLQRPDNWSNTVAKAKTNTGVVTNVVDAGRVVDMEREKGLGTAKDFAAELLSMLPKYGEDTDRDKGLNLAMIGFSIMAGESPNPLVNIGKGVMKVLPSIMKDVKDRKKYERDIQTITARYGIKKADVIEQEKRKKSSYVATQNFIDPTTGIEYVQGQTIPLNESAYNEFLKNGTAKFITLPDVYKQQLVTNATKAKNAIENNPLSLKNRANLYEKTTTYKPFEAMGDDFSIPVQYAKFGTAALGLPEIRMLNAQGSVDALYGHYQMKIGKFQNILATTQVLKEIASTDEITGSTGVFNEINKNLKAVIPKSLKNKYTELTGINLDKNITLKNEFEIKQRMLTLEVTPLLLGESAKTISDADRILVAQALGFKNARVVSEGIIDYGEQTLFESKDEIISALNSVDGFMRRRTEETNTAFNGALSQLMLEAPEQPKVETSPIGQIANLYDIVDGTLQLRKS